MPPETPNVIGGKITKGPLEDTSLFKGTVVDGGQTVDFILDEGSSVGTEVTVTLTHTPSNEILTETTNSLGDYAFDLANLTASFSSGDAFTIRASNVTATKELRDKDHRAAKAYKQILVDQRGDEYTAEYPVPVSGTVSLKGVSDVNILSAGVISTNNSTTAILAGDAVFTGTGDDVSPFATVSILYNSDVAAAASGLSIQFSQDNTNWDVQLVGDLGEKTFQVHRLVPAARFFRVVYTNGSSAQAHFRLQCIFHASASPVLITRAGQPQSTVDATPTRQATEIDLDFARRHIPGGRSFFFFGHNDAVGTSYVDIWPGNTDLNWQTTAAKIKVQSSDAADTSDGAGVRSIEIHGLSATGVDQSEVIAMNGTTAVESVLTYIRINKMHNETVGTYGGSHQGDIECRVTNATFANGALLSKMVGEEGSAGDDPQYGLGEASNGYWTVPLGKVLYITNITVNVQAGTNKSADVVLYEREGILDTSAPMDPRRIIWNRFDIEGAHTEIFKSHIKIKQLTDLWFRAEAEAASTRIDVKCHFYLLDRDADGA